MTWYRRNCIISYKIQSVTLGKPLVERIGIRIVFITTLLSTNYRNTIVLQHGCEYFLISQIYMIYFILLYLVWCSVIWLLKIIVEMYAGLGAGLHGDLKNKMKSCLWPTYYYMLISENYSGGIIYGRK